MTARTSPRWPLLVALAAVLVHGRAFENGFALDDIRLVESNPAIDSLARIPHLFLEPYWNTPGEHYGLYRPLTVVSLAIDRAVFGPAPFGFHLVNVLLHAGVLFAVWWISTAPVDEELPETAVTFYAAPPPPPPPPPPPAKKKKEKKPIVKKPDVIVQPTVIPTVKPPEVEPPPDEPEQNDDDEGVEGGVEGGVVGGVVGGVIGGVAGGQLGGKTDVMAFGDGMTRPERVSGADPVYTREALEAHVQGLMIVKCIIATDGALHNCRIIKPLPFMEKAVLGPAPSRR